MGNTSSLLDRIIALHGGTGYGVYTWWSKAVGANHETVSRCLRLKGKQHPPDEWTALVELLERTPPENWPERWQRH